MGGDHLSALAWSPYFSKLDLGGLWTPPPLSALINDTRGKNARGPWDRDPTPLSTRRHPTDTSLRSAALEGEKAAPDSLPACSGHLPWHQRCKNGPSRSHFPFLQVGVLDCKPRPCVCGQHQDKISAEER